jgi:hypothetical protein
MVPTALTAVLAAPSASISAAAVALALLAALAALAAAVRFVLRRRRGPPPLSRVLLAGSLREANLPRPRRHRGEG